ncbi:hypothetical protein V6X63_10025 [Spiribacter sp. 221]|uniref:hypothetical protein n=1 Tax=Spiribacter onubensis TaxID=3122420 RepID=UPI00349F2A0D
MDLGYHDWEFGDSRVLHHGKAERVIKAKKRLLRRRQPVGPSIGCLKPDHRMRCNVLKGARGDAIKSILAAAGFNIRWLVMCGAGYYPTYCDRWFSVTRMPTLYSSQRSHSGMFRKDYRVFLRPGFRGEIQIRKILFIGCLPSPAVLQIRTPGYHLAFGPHH